MDDLLVEQAPDENVSEARVGIFLEPARAGAIPWIGGQQRASRIRLVEVGADDARVADRQISVHQHWDATEPASALILVVTDNWRDRVGLIVEALEVDAREDHADVRGD